MKTSASGAIIETSEYEPYGRLLNRANDNRAGYTGHVMDAASGLTYMQQRYYDPSIGRFLSVDPVTANSTGGGNFNRYWYVENNPYKYIDPDGKQLNPFARIRNDTRDILLFSDPTLSKEDAISLVSTLEETIRSNHTITNIIENRLGTTRHYDPANKRITVWYSMGSGDIKTLLAYFSELQNANPSAAKRLLEAIEAGVRSNRIRVDGMTSNQLRETIIRIKERQTKQEDERRRREEERRRREKERSSNNNN